MSDEKKQGQVRTQGLPIGAAVTQKPPASPLTERIPGPVRVPFPNQLGTDFSYDALQQARDPVVRRRAHEPTFPSVSHAGSSLPPASSSASDGSAVDSSAADRRTLEQRALVDATEEARFEMFVRVNLDVTLGRMAPSAALARYGLSPEQKTELDTRFRERMKQDPALAQRYMRAAAEYALKRG